MFKTKYRSYNNFHICFLIVLNLYSKLFRKGSVNDTNCPRYSNRVRFASIYYQ